MSREGQQSAGAPSVGGDLGRPSAATGQEAADLVFAAEQAHLSETYGKLEKIGRDAIAAMEAVARDAAEDKKSMAEELAVNFATWDDILETHADIVAMNNIIEAHDMANSVQAERLRAVEVLLREPYFAKIALQFKEGAPAKELYIGSAGISDENYRRLVVDWRSPVAEVYYNQTMGPTSYVADGRTIHVDLQLRRQFEIEEDRLITYFDSDVAIEDKLLLASLSRGRSAHMQAITATIQREQNAVVRHEDVPVLQVAGIAGSGKTSVFMQRIAYLFYQHRGALDPTQVFLISPNPVFGRYIDRVLPDLGERNPEILTWEEFLSPLLPAGRGVGESDVSLERLRAIDAAVASFEFARSDFRDITSAGVRLLGGDAVEKVSAKFANLPAGPHRATLMAEELSVRLTARLKSLAAQEDTHDEIASLPVDEQLRLFGEVFDPQSDEEARTLALVYLEEKHTDALRAMEAMEWLDVDRVAARLLGREGLTSVEWVYLKMALTGLGNPEARYVMIDEAQDYSQGQLAVLARYFRRAHFLLLGDLRGHGHVGRDARGVRGDARFCVAVPPHDELPLHAGHHRPVRAASARGRGHGGCLGAARGAGSGDCGVRERRRVEGRVGGSSARRVRRRRLNGGDRPLEERRQTPRKDAGRRHRARRGRQPAGNGDRRGAAEAGEGARVRPRHHPRRLGPSLPEQRHRPASPLHHHQPRHPPPHHPVQRRTDGTAQPRLSEAGCGVPLTKRVPQMVSKAVNKRE